MNREAIIESFLRLKAEGRDGFTLDDEGREHKPNTGFAVAILSPDTVDEAIKALSGTGEYVGYWLDHKTHQEHIAVVRIFDSNLNAFANAMFFKQKAMYNFSTDEVIDLRSFYENEV